ncbi:hypothetical protein [Luteimicrobium subarcticum]|uniref:Uncharacterized protein n=1 Tax=Luteimicrobium subarcticum TaxID=620910 RepID=A0A2M8WUI6_9MICO|nr:hypothetical protein [Luteimicrobium subarcticum]PJI94574.1 hypothetical protein CLV34_0418 [Luteimicrobium subarcticum]
MHVDLSFEEARALALRGEPLPPVVPSLTCEDDTVYVTVDLRAIPNPPGALRFAAVLTPQVHVAARYESFDDGVLGLRVTATAAGLPIQKLLGFVDGPLRSFLRSQGLPEDAVTIVTGSGDPLAKVQVQEVADRYVAGATVTGIDLGAGRISLDLAVAPTFRVLD